MNSVTNSESALKKFTEKIDFTKLEGNPEDFFKEGLAFVENGQFDDGIIEFVKIIKTISHQDVLFVNAVKELKSMGFSSADISAIPGSPETVKDVIPDPVLTASAPAVSKSNTIFAGVMIVTIVILLFGCLSLFSDTSPESYERSGNLFFAAVVLGPFYLIPLIIVISIIAIGKKNSNNKLQEKMNSSTNSGSGLSRFTEKTDFTNLKGEPKDFYEAGVVFVEKGQFDDGIMEFVKVIKTASLEDNLYVLAQKELENMGFSKMDIENARQKNA